ncbi:MAG: sulfate permease [Clostridia bacterium]|nr:sulfate permease [Clostridia bacterium]
MKTFKPKLFTTLRTYSKKQFINDITAGTIVAIIALPLSIALGIASGVTPEKGLVTAIIAGFIISFFGGSRVQIGGPTGAFMIIVYNIVAAHGISGLITATFMAGVIMILFGLLRLGSVIKFVPYPIISGFTSGIALVIFTSQIKDFMGIELKGNPTEFLEIWRNIISSLGEIRWETVAVGAAALAILILWPRVSKKIPASLIAIIFTTAAVFFFKMDVMTIGGKFQNLSGTFPAPAFPVINMELVKSLIGPAVSIAILGSIESLLSAVVADGVIGGKHRSNTELIAQGMANIASSFFGGIPATGAIARTMANIKNGGRTPVAGIVHSIVLAIIMIFLLPLAKLIPMAALSAILIMVAYNMSEWREFLAMFKSPKSDLAVMLITFGLTVMIDLVVAIEVGMVLAAILFMKRMADVTNVKEIKMDAAEEANGIEREDIIPYGSMPPGIQIYEINGPFFFAAAEKFIDGIKTLNSQTRIVIIRMRNVPFIDATALRTFEVVVRQCNSKKIELLVSGLNPKAKKELLGSKVYEKIGSERFFKTVEEATAYGKTLI